VATWLLATHTPLRASPMNLRHRKITFIGCFSLSKNQLSPQSTPRVSTAWPHHLPPDLFASSYHCLYPHLPLLHVSQRSHPYLKALKVVTFIPINKTLTTESCLVSFFSSPSFGPQVESLFGTLNNWVPAGGDINTGHRLTQ